MTDLAHITDQHVLDDIVDMAGYGIGYWARTAHVDADAKTYTVTDSNDSAEYRLTFEDIRNGVAALAKGDARVRGDIRTTCAAIVGGSEDAYGDVDAEVADCIVQAAAFKEVRYG